MHRRLISLARSTPFSLVVTIAASFIAGILIISQAWAMSQVINNVYLNGQELDDVWSGMRLMAALIAGRAILAWISDFSAGTVAIRIKSDLRQRLFEHLTRLGPAYARGGRTGEISTTVVEGVEALDAYFSQYLPQLVISALVPLTILLFVFPIDLLSGIVLLLTAPLIPFFMVLIGRTAEALTRRQYETLGRLSAHFLDSLQGLTTLKQFGASKAHAMTIARASDQFRDRTLSVLRVTFLSAFALELIATISTAVVAVEVGLRLLHGQMNFQPALFVLILAPEFYMPLRMLGLRFHAGMSGTSAARRIFEILDTPPPPETQAQTDREFHLQDSITFENVGFTYPGEGHPVLQGINLDINAGQRIALVGPSGAGKTTLASILLRFLSPTEGRVQVGEKDLLDIPPDEWRKQIAWVPQKPYLFHDTIAANLRVADPCASDESLCMAARNANLDAFIESLPGKYNTVIGEGGARLSGGQAQRLAIARAFLKDAPVLILDEPTSSLDPEQESLFELAVQRLTAGRTTLIIAHRLNTVFRADQIVVLDSGQIAETGTHASLLAMGGHYAGMVTAHDLRIEQLADSLKPEEDIRIFEENIGRFSPPVKSPLVSKPRFSLWRLLRFLSGSWMQVGESTLLGALTIFASVGLMGTSAYLLSAAALHPSIAALQVAIVGVRFFGISRGVFRYSERLVSHNVTFRLLARLRVWFYEALEPLAPARLMQYRAGDLLSRVVADVDALENFYVRAVAPPLVAVFVIAGTTWLLGSFHPSLGWLLLGFLLTLGFIVPLFSELIARKPGQKLVSSRAELHASLVDNVQGLADLIVFGRQADRQRDISRTGYDYAHSQRLMSAITGLNSSFSVLLANLGMWSVLFVAIPLVSGQVLSGVVLASLALIALAAFEAVMPLPQAAQMMGVSAAAARRLFEVVDSEAEVREPMTPLPAPRTGVIQFNRLTFRYPDLDKDVLREISFSLEAGKRLAVVGPSGAGKSTLVNLLMRFWESPDGLQLDEQPIQSFKPDDVRRLFAVVSQNAFFFNATIKQNLLLARPKATLDGIAAACRQAQISEFIEGLPLGYETWIGEQGARLSGGERQRLAIARALLKEAPILLLDEPTANLDPLTEKSVLAALRGVMQDRTTLMITHRLVSLDMFDEIIVLDQGRVVERGNHESLIAQPGLYRRMGDLQNRFFLADA